MGVSQRCVRRRVPLTSSRWLHLFLCTTRRLQTPVYSIFQVPTIVSAAILLTTRHLNISLPSTRPNCWWELFDAEWDDIWIVCGFIMRLYRERDPAEMMKVVKMVNKTEVRRWLEKQQLEARNQDQNGSATTTTPG